MNWHGACPLKHYLWKEPNHETNFSIRDRGAEAGFTPRDHGLSRGADSFRKGDQVVLTGGPYYAATPKMLWMNWHCATVSSLATQRT
jgi:hypothetical protein